jgi:hypothetical protein
MARVYDNVQYQKNVLKQKIKRKNKIIEDQKKRISEIDFNKLFKMTFEDKIDRDNFDMDDDEFENHIRNLYDETNYHKVCSCCKQNKRFSEYSFNMRNKNHLETRCKICYIKYNK